MYHRRPEVIDISDDAEADQIKSEMSSTIETNKKRPLPWPSSKYESL